MTTKTTPKPRALKPILDDLSAIRADLNKRFRRCEATVETMMASLLAGELILLIGPRGEAKTAIVEALAGYIADGDHFSVGLSKTSTPDDILGGVDTPAYVNDGIYRRRADGFLPTSTTFLLDEGFKGPNPVLQSLLRLLSERTFQGQGIPTLFGAICSNELPPELRGQKNGKAADLGPFEESLLAFFDRFTHKVMVDPLPVGTSDWNDVVFGGCADVAANVSVSVADLRAAQSALMSVKMPDNVRDAIRDLAGTLADGSAGGVVHVSTRSWRKITRIVRAHAMLDGRTEVRRSDLRWLEHALWTTPDQRQTLREAISGVGSPEVAEAMATEAKVAEVYAAYMSRRLFIDATGDLQVADSPVSELSAASASEPFARWLKRMVNTLRTLEATAEDVAEVQRVRVWADDLRVVVLEDINKRLRSI